eukprot:5944548-Lingulodinium_polyedra.AAC.1
MKVFYILYDEVDVAEFVRREVDGNLFAELQYRVQIEFVKRSPTAPKNRPAQAEGTTVETDLAEDEELVSQAMKGAECPSADLSSLERQ